RRRRGIEWTFFRLRPGRTGLEEMIPMRTTHSRLARVLALSGVLATTAALAVAGGVSADPPSHAPSSGWRPQHDERVDVQRRFDRRDFDRDRHDFDRDCIPNWRDRDDDNDRIPDWFDRNDRSRYHGW